MQDTKNLILACVLCVLVLTLWGPFAQYMGWIVPPDPAEIAQREEEVKQEKAKAEERKKEAERAANLPTFVPSKGRDIVIDTPLYKAVVYSGGGLLKSFKLKKYHTQIGENTPLVDLVSELTSSVAPLGLVINSQPSWSTGKWTMEDDVSDLSFSDGNKTLRFIGEVDNIRVIRELSFDAKTYLIKEKISLINKGDQDRSVRVSYTVAMDRSNSTDSQYDAMRIAWDEDGKLKEENSEKTLMSTGIQSIGNIYWAGAMSTYFLAAVMPERSDNLTIKGLMQKGVYRTALEEPDIVLKGNGENTLSTAYWFGPKDRREILLVSEQLGKSIDLGFFGIIGKALMWLLEFFYSYVQNWGIAIILLTILIKALFWPLTAKSYSSMEKMKKLQPQMTALREKYKDDKEKMNKEVMALYKTYGVNPASGCVPVLIQLPVFFGLYQALLSAIELRHASFITYLPFTDSYWLADLSSKDPFYITPIIMGLTMFLQQKMSPSAPDPMQQRIMMFLPLIFTVLFLGFPSGLVIYWLLNNILSIFQQWMMIKKNKGAKAK